MRFENFSIWRGRLPHWRADGVRYYVTFKHRRELTPEECDLLCRYLLRPDGRKWDLTILCVLPALTELIFEVHAAPTGRPYELSDIVEKTKTKVGKLIIKKTGERFPPFYGESYDRIIRDEAELEEYWNRIFLSPIAAELAQSPEEYPAMWVAGAP
ncbi:MAG: hypothetical protein ABL962_19680 [Fimbriimonadaceae bacterium]